MKTQILTLSVHDDNAFDGIEIALHPDLFSQRGISATKERTNVRDAPQLIQAEEKRGKFKSDSLFQTAHRSTNPELMHDVDNKIDDNQISSSCSLKAGDLIEIRVWDKKVGNAGNISSKTGKYSSQQEVINMFSKPNVPKTQTQSTPSVFPLDSTPSPSDPNLISMQSQCISTPPDLGKESIVQPRLDVNEKKRSPRLPFGVDIADAAIRNSPNTYRRSASSKSPNSSNRSTFLATGNSVISAENTGNKDDNMSFYSLRVYFVMRVSQKSLAAIKETARIQISIKRQVADLYKLSSFDKVTVTKVSKSQEALVLQSASADFVTVTIKDQFICRGEMFHVQKFLMGKWMYEGERIHTPFGFKANARQIRHGDKIVQSGIVTKNTKITFRSRSSRIIWLVQISTEMWDYASPYKKNERSDANDIDEKEDGEGICEIYFDKFVRFMHKLFEKWKNLEVTHSLTIIFFSRTFINPNRGDGSNLSHDAEVITSEQSAIKIDFDGRLYEDHYKMIIENETRTDWETLIYKVKKEFLQYPTEVGWNERDHVPSNATQGNVLEAINVTLNLLQLHYMDRDLYRTGNSIVIVSPGQGVFEVNKGLAGITKQRMMDNGIGSDMLSLGVPPMHIAPFFLYKSSEMTMAKVDESNLFDDWKTYFEVPHWMHLSFLNYDNEKAEPSALTKNHMDNQISFGANGFVIHKLENHDDKSVLQGEDSAASLGSFVDGQQSKWQQRNLISGRDFDDILEACRPRKRGESMTRIPSALIANLRMSSTSSKEKTQYNTMQMPRMPILLQSIKDSSSDVLSISSSSTTSVKGPNHRYLSSTKPGSHYMHNNSPHLDRTNNESHDLTSSNLSLNQDFELKEWRTVNFDDFMQERVFPIKKSALHTLAERASDSQKSPDRSETSSPCSSFNSTYSHLLAKSPTMEKKRNGSILMNQTNGIDFNTKHIQPSTSIETYSYLKSRMGEEQKDYSVLENLRSDESLHLAELEEDALKGNKVKQPKKNPTRNETNLSATLNELKNQMFKYDSNVFARSTKLGTSSKHSSTQKVNSHSMSTFASSVLYEPHASTWRRSQDNLDRSSHSRRRGFDSRNTSNNAQQGGGIEAALMNFNKANKSLVHTSNSNIRRIMSSRRFPSGMGQFGSIAGVNSGSGGNFIGLSTSLGLSMSPPTKSLAINMNVNPPDLIQGLPGHFALLIPPGGTTTELGKINTAGWENHFSKKSTQPYENLQRKHNKSGVLSNVMDQDKSVQENKHNIQKQHHQSSQHLNHGQITKATYQQGKKNSGKTKKRHSKHNQIANIGKSINSPRQKPWVLNPFRQQDEDDVLAKRTHNRRRWSHVFPLGEVEFKRHAGPNWKSLCQPAVLPLTIDYHPSQNDLLDKEKYRFSYYEIRLDAMDGSNYKNHSEYLLELVTQRLIQDYQVVPQDIVRQGRTGSSKAKQVGGGIKDKKGFRKNIPPERNFSFFQSQTLKASSQTTETTHTLSMGHRIHQISYNPISDAIKVIQYNAKFAQNDSSNVQTYNYMLWAPSINRFLPVMQKFKKYSNVVYWNKLDNLICGDPEKRFTEETRFRRLVFTIIPDDFGKDIGKEQEYIKKFQRLLEYILKQRQKRPEENEIEIISSATPDEFCRKKKIKSNDYDKSFMRYTIPLAKGESEKYEWMDILVDSTFDTRKSYHILIHWLVASGSRVENHVQLLHRRCSQFGLNLVSVPQYSMSDTIFLHPLVCPTIIPVYNREDCSKIGVALIERFNFVFDGHYWIDTNEFHGINDFDFTRKKSCVKNPNTNQYIHKSGSIFVRALHDNKGWTLYIMFVNRRVVKDEAQIDAAHQVFHSIQNFINDMKKS